MTELHLYRLDDGCEHTMAAKDEATALREGREVYSIGEGMYDGDEVEISQIPDDEKFTLRFPDGLEGEVWPPEAVVTQEPGVDPRATATAAEWARFCGDGVYVGGEEC